MDTGIKGFKEIIVTKELTAMSMGSGDLDVYATPSMRWVVDHWCLLSPHMMKRIKSAKELTRGL